MENKLPKRKQNRSEGYDYGTAGVYFITSCIKDRRAILSRIPVGETSGLPFEPVLTRYGEIVKSAIENIPKYYPTVFVSNYVIMPDHIHLMLEICSNNCGRPMVSPTVNRVLQQTKGYITKQIGFSIWQRSFYDHVVRNENDYKDIWQYIENNPIKIPHTGTTSV